jgi:PAS domain S-box-containing protein
VLLLGYRSAGRLTPETELLAGSTGRLIALAISGAVNISQMVSAQTTLQGHTRKLQRLFQVLDRFSKVHTEEEILEMIPKLTCTALEYNYALVERIEGSQLKIIGTATRKPARSSFTTTITKQGPRAIFSGGLAEQVLASNELMVITQPASDPRVRRRFAKDNFAELVVAPLIVGGRQIGVVYAAHHTGSPALQTADLELLSVFMKICDYALSNIFYVTHRRRGIDISRIPAGSVEEFIGEVVSQLPGVVGARHAVIALPDQHGVLVPMAATAQRSLTDPYRHWLAALPFRRFNFRLPGFPETDDPDLHLIDGSLISPILYEKENLGVVHLFNRISGNFSEEDLATIRAVATRIGYVLKNLELVHSLRDERQQFASIVRGSADGLLSLDAGGQVEFINPAMEDLTGYREAEVVGKTCDEVFDPRDETGEPFDFTWAQPGRRRTAPVRNATILTKSGTRRWVGITTAPDITDHKGTHTIVVVRDITEQRELQQRQTEFVAIASHELRTPITALTGYLSLLQGGQSNSKEQLNHFVDRAYHAATRLQELVEDLLNVARIEEGRLALKLKPLNPTQVLGDIITNLRPSLSRKKLSLEVYNRLEPRDEIRADPTKLTQIFANLIDNAIKYTPEGGRIKVTTQASARFITISVSDDGIGIHPDNLERIFEKFFREYTELSVTAGGTGLGLFITRELIERQGGKLKITSAQGKGTTATVRFPRSTS